MESQITELFALECRDSLNGPWVIGSGAACVTKAEADKCAAFIRLMAPSDSEVRIVKFIREAA